MPARFTSGEYDPETAKLMGEALDQAWIEFEPKPRDFEFARSLMATAILERYEAGHSELKELVRDATVALMSAIKADPDRLR